MAYFFSEHPYVVYDVLGTSQPRLAVDITRRFRLDKITKNNKLVYYDYDIKDRDRPDIMADKYYGNSSLDWLFFITNEIFDPYFQWPLNYKQFTDYVRQKYGSVSNAQAQTHHYEQILQLRTEIVDQFDDTFINIPERTIQVDYTTYLTLAPSYRRQITTFDFEESENNRKRSIKILDAAFVPDILQQLDGIFQV